MINKIKSKLQTWLMPEPYIEVDNRLSGKIVIVTGGASGIGRAVVDLLSKKGASVISFDRAISLSRSKVASEVVDVTKFDSVVKAVNRVAKKWGRVDALINCAGIFSDKKLIDIAPVEFAKVIDVNLLGIVHTSKAVLPTLIKQRSGTIINIGSKISHNTNVDPGKVAYATSKYAVEGFSFALNKELKGTGVRVCALMPGTVATFVSRQGKNYLSPYELADLIRYILESPNLDIESIVVKSRHQNI